jgi:hypothetical protein
MEPAVQDLDDKVLWDRVALVIAGILEEDEMRVKEEEDKGEELEGYTTKVLAHLTHILNAFSTSS